VRFRNEGIHFCSIAEGINTTTPGGKLVYHLFAAMAEFQRDVIRENTVLGLESARLRGKALGRPPRLDIGRILSCHEAVVQDGMSISEVARRYKVSHATITRGLKRAGLEWVHQMTSLTVVEHPPVAQTFYPRRFQRTPRKAYRVRVVMQRLKTHKLVAASR
jgi:DNA invertase Pin-like site-specific DNA recombinase